jgi:hypothetical protein
MNDSVKNNKSIKKSHFVYIPKNKLKKIPADLHPIFNEVGFKDGIVLINKNKKKYAK